MEPILSAIVSDLLGRALSMAIRRYRQSSGAEHKLQQLQSVLLRIDAMVEEAEGRHVTNQAMLRQLDMLRHGMYDGHYMLDTFKYRDHGVDGEVSGGRPVALSRLSSAKRLLLGPANAGTANLQGSALDAESVSKLEKMLCSLEMMIGDMEEFAVFLEGNPRIFRQPCSTYLILDKVMFGRQMEKETIINFLLCPGAAGDRRPGVLPITGPARVGKSTLVEHVILDERVRSYFASIVLFTGDDLGAGKNMAAFRSSGVIKHQDLTAASNGRSLAVIELGKDMDGETWRRLYSSAASNMAHGSKIIITSRSGEIAALGTTHALRLKLLTREAYWYFFKSLAFGGTSPGDHPELASLGMEIATQLNGLFLGGNIVASLLRVRENLSAPFWRKVLQCLRAFTSRHLLMFGEHPSDRLQKGEPVYSWRIARSPDDVMVFHTYQKPSAQHDLPKLTATDIITGNVPQQGKFRAVAWRSNIPPYYTYLTSCTSQTGRCSVVGKKRSRDARV